MIGEFGRRTRRARLKSAYISLRHGAETRTLFTYFASRKAQTRKSAGRAGRANIRQSFPASTRRLRNGTICRMYPMAMASKRCSPGRCRSRFSSCFQASVHSSENSRPDGFSGLFAIDPPSGVFISSTNRLQKSENAEKSRREDRRLGGAGPGIHPFGC